MTLFFLYAERLISRFSSEIYIALLQQLWQTALVWNLYPIFILLNNLAVKITLAESLFWMHLPYSQRVPLPQHRQFAFEFDLVRDFMAIFSNKQTEVSTGEKTYHTTVYKVWKHVAWSTHAVKWWQYVGYPIGWWLFAWHFLLAI